MASVPPSGPVGAVPRLHWYHGPLRLPLTRPRFLVCAHTCDQVPGYLPSDSFFPATGEGSRTGPEGSLPVPGGLFYRNPIFPGASRQEMNGSRMFPSFPVEGMPWSKTTVVRWMLAIPHPRLLLSSALRLSAFPRLPEVSHRTTNVRVFGAHTEPAFPLTSASDSRCRAYP